MNEKFPMSGYSLSPETRKAILTQESPIRKTNGAIRLKIKSVTSSEPTNPYFGKKSFRV